MDNLIHTIWLYVLTVWPLVLAMLLAALTKIVLSQPVQDAIAALGHKLAAQTEQLVAQADAQNNSLLTLAVHGAMTYAEVHQGEVLAVFDTKAEYVIAAIQKDPRFAGTGVPLEAIKHTIEQLWVTYFGGLVPVKSGDPSKTPADITPGGPPAPPGN